MSLLTKAKSYEPRKIMKRAPTKEEIELAVAWAQDEIMTSPSGSRNGCKSPSEPLTRRTERIR